MSHTNCSAQSKMKIISQLAEWGLALATFLCVCCGIFLLWACQSYYAFIWLQAKTTFPKDGVSVVMVNTEETLHIRDKYPLPPDAQNNLALRALIIDRDNKLVATAWREGYLNVYLPSKDLHGNTKINVPDYETQAVGWMKAAKIVGWFLLFLGLFQTICLCFIKLKPKPNKIASE